MELVNFPNTVKLGYNKLGYNKHIFSIFPVPKINVYYINHPGHNKLKVIRNKFGQSQAVCYYQVSLYLVLNVDYSKFFFFETLKWFFEIPH
jgi:hypothetical protein